MITYREMNDITRKTQMQVQTVNGTAPSTSGVREYMDSRQLAEWLGISLRTVVNLRRRHVLPYIKIGRVVRFRREKVEQALRLYTVEGLGVRRAEPPIQPSYNPAVER